MKRKTVVPLRTAFAIGGVAIALAVFSAPEERFFDWTRLPFDADVYRQRRTKLISVLQSSGGGIFLAPSRHARSHGETFRQSNDFLYFTGLELPDSVLTIDADKEKTILFVPSRDPRFEDASRPNDFPGRPLEEDPALAGVSGITEIRPYRQLAQFVTEWVESNRLFKINPEHRGEISAPQTDFVSYANHAQSLIFHLQQGYPGVRIRSAYPEMAQLRMIKGPEEIEVMRRACALTAESIMKAALAIRDGVDERTLEAVLESAFKRGGASGLHTLPSSSRGRTPCGHGGSWLLTTTGVTARCGTASWSSSTWAPSSTIT